MRALCILAVLESVALLACSRRADHSTSSTDANANVAGPNGASGAPSAAGGSIGGSTGALSNSAGAAAAPGNPATGGSGTSGAGTAGASGVNGVAGSTLNSGTGGAGGSASTEPFLDLSFAGLVSALELAPVRLAANGIYPARIAINSGGVDNLFAANGAVIATNAETQALRASVQHPNLRIIFTVCEGLYRIVAKKSAGIAALADLRGKTIATLQGTSSEYFLSRMLAVANLTERDVNISNQSPGMGTLTADAATIWEPGIQYVANGLGTDAIELQHDDQGREVYRELFNLHTTAENLADPKKRRSIVQFVRALIAASEQIRQDPTPVWPLLTGPTGASQANLEKSWKYERFAGTLVSDLLDVLEQEEPWRANIDGRPARTRDQLAPLIDDSVLKEAMGP